MLKLVECVPNFSEGKDKCVIDAIAAAVKASDGVKLLGVDPDGDYNRVVVTFVGDPDSAVNAAFNAVKKASELIDMTKQKGEHPRLGATDVVPFIPLQGVTMQDCVEMSKKLGKRIADELKIPVYLYAEAAQKKDRVKLPTIREGEYEGLPQKLQNPEWAPDFGEPVFNAKSGATVTGARFFLIAYNINLKTTDVALADDIAQTVRESGRILKDAQGNKILDEFGKAKRQPGILPATQAKGIELSAHGITQVSMNLLNYNATPPHVAFETVKKLAAERGVETMGSELVGLIPLEALLLAGKFYAEKAGKNPAEATEEELIEAAVKSLGLSSLAPFVPAEKVIEYQIKNDAACCGSAKKGRLVSMKLCDFVDLTASDAPAPGGGSISALSGANAAALCAMVARLTIGKKKYSEVEDLMRRTAEAADKIKDRYVELIDEDTAAFDKVMAAFAMPKETDEDKVKRAAAIEEATVLASEVPLESVRLARELMTHIETVLGKGNKNSASDAAVAAAQAVACAQGAAMNVFINTSSLKTAGSADKLNAETRILLAEAEKRGNAVVEEFRKSFNM